MIFKQKWMGRRFMPDGTELNGVNTFPVEVPGNIQYDYAVANNFGDFQFSDNVNRFVELENSWWEYSIVLSYRATKGEHVWFVAEGVDYIS